MTLPFSPKQKKKAVGFWNKDKTSRKSQKSIFKKKLKDSELVKDISESLDNKLEDKHRRRFFSHHDIGLFICKKKIA